MPAVLFFNECYFDELLSCSIEGAIKLCDAVLGLKKAIQQGANNSLVTTSEIRKVKITNEYTINDWFKDERKTEGGELIVDKDLRSYFARKIDRAPFYEEDILESNDEFLENEVVVTLSDIERSSDVLTYSYLTQGIVLSPSISIFNKPIISAQLCHVNSDETEDVNIRCIINEDSVSTHAGYIRSLAGIDISQASDIWKYKSILFPNLEFCERVESQLSSFSKFSVIMSRLLELQEYSESWDDGPFQYNKIPSKVTSEGEQVRNSKKACDDRTYELPNGERLVFFWHLRATPGAIRIYFYPRETEERKGIIIGHIGGKPYYPTD